VLVVLVLTLAFVTFEKTESFLKPKPKPNPDRVRDLLLSRYPRKSLDPTRETTTTSTSCLSFGGSSRALVTCPIERRRCSSSTITPCATMPYPFDQNFLTLYIWD
jgi:hypothetical protein